VSGRISTYRIAFALGFTVAGCLVGCGAERYPGATIAVLNVSEEAICEVYLSQAPGEWGEDELEESERLENHQARSFDLQPGTWHIRTDNCRGGMVFTRHGLTVRGHMLVQVRPPKASIDRKRIHWIAEGVRRSHEL